MKTLDRFQPRGKVEEERWRKLLKEVKVTKDNVGRKDIWLTQTEVDVIDTPEFQRLRRIFQLGPAFLVYIGATHTRLEHCIGTLHKAKLIIDAINRNYTDSGRGYEVSLRETFLIRLAALLHDVVFLTYGHILEDEGRLLPKRQWEDDYRVEKFLGEKSNIGRKISENICEIFGDERGRDISEEIMEQLIKVLSACIEEDIRNLGDLAFVADIVSNTICADLLDYLERDIQKTGVFGEYDPRMISYFTVQEFNGRPRLVIKLYKKDVNEPIRWDVLNSILTCLRLRYELSASVYSHHTRKKASAIITKMVSAAMKALRIDTKNISEADDFLCNMDDFSLPHFILNLDEKGLTGDQEKDLKTAKSLAKKFLDRKLYCNLYELSREEYAKNSTTMERLEDLAHWERRYDFETKLEKLTGMEPGSIIAYIPDPLSRKEPGMGLKEAKVLVETKYGIGTLESLGAKSEYKATIGDEIDVIKEKHKALFRFSIFASPELQESEETKIVKSIAEEWLEGTTPMATIEAVASQEKMELKKPIAVIAEQMLKKFGSQKLSRPPDSKTSLFSEFENYIRKELKELE